MKYRILEVTNGLGEKTWSFQKQIINSLGETGWGSLASCKSLAHAEEKALEEIVYIDKEHNTVTETKVVREYN